MFRVYQKPGSQHEAVCVAYMMKQNREKSRGCYCSRYSMNRKGKKKRGNFPPPVWSLGVSLRSRCHGVIVISGSWGLGV